MHRRPARELARQRRTELGEWISAGERDAHFLRVEILDARCEQPPRQVREQRIDRISRLQEELPPEFASPIRAGEIRVQSIEQTRANLRVRLSQAEEPDDSLLEQIV